MKTFNRNFRYGGRWRASLVLASMMLAGVLALAGCTPGGDGASQNQPVQQPPPQSPTNAALLAAASPFEDLTEFAEAGDVQGMDRAIQAFEQQAEAARAELAAPARQRLDSLVTAINEARAAGRNRAVALDAVEAYRVLISSLDEATLTVLKQVSLLDYAGFKLNVLAGADAPDWAAMKQTAQEAQGYWDAVEGQVEEPGLRDAVKTVIGGMTQAAQAEDARMAGFAARVDLDLVDLLEHYFEEVARASPAATAPTGGEQPD